MFARNRQCVTQPRRNTVVAARPRKQRRYDQCEKTDEHSLDSAGRRLPVRGLVIGMLARGELAEAVAGPRVGCCSGQRCEAVEIGTTAFNAKLLFWVHPVRLVQAANRNRYAIAVERAVRQRRAA